MGLRGGGRKRGTRYILLVEVKIGVPSRKKLHEVLKILKKYITAIPFLTICPKSRNTLI